MKDKLFTSIKNDLIANRQSGVLCKLILISYRIGRSTSFKPRYYKYIFSPLYLPLVAIHKALCMLSGCSIPFATNIGSSVVFKHGFYGVFISSYSVIGDRCTLLHQVTVGSNVTCNGKNRGGPTLGCDVFVGAGAKIIGNVKIGDGAKIGALALVVDDVAPCSTVVAPKSLALSKGAKKYQ